ncbi:mRNA cap guanine-N7 methyltransferase [Astathelohania contejeani]|uniref:mRNA cap guanine-N(7) methyltransferase n=1 Tax=Astathelohania contejeani TaxID=164912 RepID=A0ABQ7I1Z6_9MICR|nr:mRNA cap guanine-N7 methyltransferase [Thelohania contejeani]
MKKRKSEDEKVRSIAEHYNKIPSLKREERHKSKIINIRNMNNFIKSLLIKTYTHQNFTVLDLGCGKGGDLNKYKIAKISKYIGIDIAEKSIEEAKSRYKQGNYDFECEFDCLDAYNTFIDKKWKCDIVSSQFSFHYAFSSIESLKIAVKNVALQLKPGGHFILTIPDAKTIIRRYKKYGNDYGNEYHKIHFLKEEFNEKECGIEYEFRLEEAVDNCVEYIADLDLLISECSKQEMFLVETKTFLEYFNVSVKKDLALYNKLVPERLKNEELKVIELYRIVVFKKNNK